MSDPFAQFGQEHFGRHPDVALAKRHQERIDRITAFREAEPEPDLREAVRELAEVLMNVTTTLVGQAVTESLNNPNSAVAEVDLEQLNRAHDKVCEIARRLA